MSTYNLELCDFGPYGSRETQTTRYIENIHTILPGVESLDSPILGACQEAPARRLLSLIVPRFYGFEYCHLLLRI